MAHVIGAGKLKAGRKPAVPVNAPVNFFSGNYIDRPAKENSCEDFPQAEQETDGKRQSSVDREQKKNVQRRRDQGHVFCFFRSTDLRVVPLMSGSQRIARTV